VRPRYAWGCDKCGAPAFEHCRSLTTGRITDTHKARLGWVGIFDNEPQEDRRG
jgi:hypothetical protein